MKKFTIFTVIALSFVVGLAAACSSGSDTTSANKTTTAETGAANTAGTKDEAPAAIKAAFPDAQTFTKQHKDIPENAIAEIEKDTGAKVPDTDHHSYLAFSTAGGARKQIGAATVVKAAGKDIVIVYESKDGSPVIKEVRADGVSGDFLKQFAGKGHDDDLLLGKDITANGVNEAEAKAITEAVRVDIMTMQALYGAEHSH